MASMSSRFREHLSIEFAKVDEDMTSKKQILEGLQQQVKKLQELNVQLVRHAKIANTMKRQANEKDTSI
eukprot:8515499-Karenia_brevis.AAC.1